MTDRARREGPKYLRIYEELRRRIEAGELSPGEQLMSQAELAATFGVTLMTLRQSLARLEAEGFIWSSRGRGTFVADEPVAVPIGNLTSFVDQMRAQGLAVETEVVAVRGIGGGGSDVRATGGPVPRETAPVNSPPEGCGPDAPEIEEARAALASPGALVEIGRLRRVRGRPLVWQQTWLTATLAQRLDLDELEKVSLYELIAAGAGYVVDRAAERISAVGLDVDAAARLGRSEGEPALRSVRTSFTADNTPFLHDRAVLVGELAAIDAERTADRLHLRYTSPELED